MKLKSFFSVLLLVGIVFSVLAPQNPLHSRSSAQLAYQVHSVANSRVHTFKVRGRERRWGALDLTPEVRSPLRLREI